MVDKLELVLGSKNDGDDLVGGVGFEDGSCGSRNLKDWRWNVQRKSY